MENENGKRGAPHPVLLQRYQNERVANWAVRKLLKTEESG
jgi:hypothetical protein